MNAQASGRHILLVEDDSSVAEMLCDVLREAGFHPSHAATGSEARALIERERPDLILLDLRLPDTDGLILCTDLHSGAHAPIIVMSATSDKRDAILAFEHGADDFVAKPLDVDHLLARVETALRRVRVAPRLSAPAPRAGERPRPAAHGDSRVKRAGALVMDHARRQVSLLGRLVPVTPTEYRILDALIDRPGEVLTRDELAMKVWSFQDAAIGRALDVHIRRLRAKLAQAGPTPPAITSVRGFGYRMDAASATEFALAS